MMIIPFRNISIVVSLTLTLIILEGISIASALHGNDQHYGQQRDWSIRIGALGLYKPEYEGSDEYEVKGLPIIDITWRDRFFLSPRKGLGAYLWNRDDVELGVSISYSFGRDEDDSDDLEGLGDIYGGTAANVLFKWRYDEFSLDARYEHQFTGTDTGFQVHLGVGYNVRLGRKIMLKPSAKTTYTSSEYMNEYFSISKSQSSRSGLSVYDTDPGFKSVGFHLLSIYSINRNWGVQAMARYGRLIGDAADSPVVKDENQYLLGLGLSYKI
jgi:outer membrane scaffolding protein for murein synthesis (MipA/OmpV family)